jgi:hypothetical protein
MSNKEKPDKLLKLIRKREREYLPILMKLRRRHPRLSDHELFAYMFLQMKDKALRLKEEAEIDERSMAFAYAFDGPRQRHCYL